MQSPDPQPAPLPPEDEPDALHRLPGGWWILPMLLGGIAVWTAILGWLC